MYLLACGSCYYTARRLPGGIVQERRAWYSISSLFLALGINKQLDLQSALTELGKIIAHAQGWYEQRRLIQLVFVGGVVLCCLLAALTLLTWTRRAPRPAWLA